MQTEKKSNSLPMSINSSTHFIFVITDIKILVLFFYMGFHTKLNKCLFIMGSTWAKGLHLLRKISKQIIRVLVQCIEMTCMMACFDQKSLHELS